MCLRWQIDNQWNMANGLRFHDTDNRPFKGWHGPNLRDRCKDRRKRNQESIDIMAFNIKINDIQDYWIGYDY